MFWVALFLLSGSFVSVSCYWRFGFIAVSCIHVLCHTPSKVFENKFDPWHLIKVLDRFSKAWKKILTSFMLLNFLFVLHTMRFINEQIFLFILSDYFISFQTFHFKCVTASPKVQPLWQVIVTLASQAADVWKTRTVSISTQIWRKNLS